MEPTRLLPICCITLLLGACAVRQPPVSVLAEPPPQWYAPLPHNGQLTDLSRWWQSLGDPLLAQLVEAAQDASPTLATAQARIAQARAARLQAAAALLPALDVSATTARGTGQAGMPAATTLQAGLQASWEVDLFGANRMVAEAAQARLESAQAQWHDARVSVAAEAANLYFSQRACERQAAIAQQDAGSRTETSRLTNMSAQAGFTAPANASLARASAAEANSRATQQRALCMRDIKALVALTAWPETELRQKLAAAPDDLGRAATLSIGAVPAQALDQRPDLFSAQRDIAVASAEVGSADAQRYPRLGLNSLIGIQHYRASAARDDGLTWSIGPLALSLPLFDAGRRVATVEAAQARYDEAAFVYRARVRQAVREVEDALVNLESTAARSDDARLAEQGYRAYLEATEARYRSGLAGQMELEEFRRNALIAATALVSLQRERSG